MTVAILLRNETLKMRKRLAFWVTFLALALIATIGFGENFFSARSNPERSFALPAAWSSILGDNNEISLIFGSVVLMLLLSSEFSWRTARQNVIDGLSKEQFFLGKVLLVPIVGLIFVGAQVFIGTIFALLGTDFGGGTAPLMSGIHLSALGGFGLAFLGYGALALFVSLAIRNSGPAMAVWFFYVAILERLLGGGLVALSESLRPIVRFLPVNTFNQLFDYRQHDPAALQRAVQNAIENNRTPPEAWDWGTLLLASTAWIVVLVAVAFAWFRQRDL